ncbi:MAG: CHASE2 domain-containing protein [Nannocystis sp.]|uniref:CHASE2 domain-containing protein n=1 Tax=Nannocystis sp. TaxID=1962667 RepID=UPI002426594D|nr:CHASE2 domain-containing protein [Nannocystis sp.]MBK9757244.1 CHASE2 domain-containing protein [Nannocystis sp.]
MPISARPSHRLVAIAGLAVAAAWSCSGLFVAAERGLHARYARALAGPSRTQAALLVAIDDAALARWGGAPPASERAALAAAIAGGAPRLVVWPSGTWPEGQVGEAVTWPEGQVGEGAVTWPEGQVGEGTVTWPEGQVGEGAVTWPEGQVGDPGYVRGEGPGGGVDPLVGAPLRRVDDPQFPGPVLAALGLAARGGPLPTRYVAQLPTVSALRVAAGEIPAGTFRDRVVVVGRTDAAASTVTTPLGLMSPAQVEAQALLGALDGALWAPAPAWWLGLLATTAWALALTAALRGRGLAAVLAITGAAIAGALVLDAGLFAAGLLRLGAGVAVTVVLVTAAARLLGLTERALPADLLERTGVAGSASGLHKVSDA